MKQRRDEAYVLGTHDLGEADVLVTLVAEHAGRVRGVAPSARRSRKRFGGTLEPLTRVRAIWIEKAGRELHRIESLDLERSYATMQSDPVRQAACAILGEISSQVSREGEADPKGFRLLGAVLEALEAGLPPWVAVRYFEYWTLRLHGILPEIAACAACGEGLPDEKPGRSFGAEGILCDRCGSAHAGAGRKLAPGDRAMLAAMGSLPPADLAPFVTEARPGGSVEHLLKGSLEAFVERPIRAYRHLRAHLA